MSQGENAAGSARPEAPAPVPGNLWSEFLRRNLLLASLAGTATTRAAPEKPERPAAGDGAEGP